MDFIHEGYEPGETIAALATPPGDGGIAIIRISGKRACFVADQIFSGNVSQYSSHTVHFGKILHHDQTVLDEALLMIMRAPRSFTGEDVAEIHCHGGALIAKLVLKRVLEEDVRLARPGEFTFKAFQNGKIDLTRAEAIQSLIASKNTHALDAARTHLEGKLFETIQSYQNTLTDTAAFLEAWVDFPEEDLELATHQALYHTLEDLMHEMETLYRTFHDGKRLQTGFSLCLIGKPNVGKSSLMNALTRQDRAIVTHLPGTTRDLLEEDIQIGDLHFRLIDTAGIRQTNEVIEKEGIIRSKKAAQKADIILLVLDVNTTADEPWIYELPPQKTLVIWNKIDLPHDQLPSLPFPHLTHVSAKENEGIDQLKTVIHQIVWQKGPPSKGEIVLTNHRHYEALGRAIQGIKKVMEGLQSSLSPEFLAADLKEALKALGLIIGNNITEDILSAIFSKFCVGK